MRPFPLFCSLKESMNALLSIKPEFVEKIFSGEKRFEFRKSAFRQDISCVIVYATAPVCRIVGEFEVEDVLQASPSNFGRRQRTRPGYRETFSSAISPGGNMP